MDTDDELITAPLVGTLYASPSLDDPPFVILGQNVKTGDVLCIIEAMKMMSEIPAPYDGTVVEIFVENEQAVGYATPLLRLRRIGYAEARSGCKPRGNCPAHHPHLP